MTTKLEVFNAALILCGEPDLNDPAAKNNAARTLRSVWNATVTACLEDGAWRFAQKRVKMARLIEKPSYGYQYFYQLPPDHLRTVFVSEFGFEESRLWQYTQENGKIAANGESLYLRYVSADYKTMMGDWPQAFADMVAANLAKRVQPRLNSSETAAKNIKDELRECRRRVQSLNLQEQPASKMPDGSWVTARGRGGAYWNSNSYDPTRGRGRS